MGIVRRELFLDGNAPAHVTVKLPRWQDGLIDARVDPDCERATMTVRTRDDSARSGDMARDVDLIAAGNTMRAEFQEDGQRVQGDSPLEVTLTLPPGSTLDCETDTADLRTDGLATVTARTGSGRVTVKSGTSVMARTHDGPVDLGAVEAVDVRTQGPEATVTARQIGILATVKTDGAAIQVDDLSAPLSRFSTNTGEISVHATGPGEMNVSASTGSITVTAADEDVAHGLQINVDSLAGAVDVPKGSTVTRGVQSARVPREAGESAVGGGRTDRTNRDLAR